MSRIISLVGLVAVLLVIAFLFFRVVADFILPMFLAVLLVIIFRPLDVWLLARCKGRRRLAAGATTTIILLVFLVPVLLLLWNASAESVKIYDNLANAADKAPEYLHWASFRVVAWGEMLGVELQPGDVANAVTTTLRQSLAPLAAGTTQFLGNFLIAIFVMMASLYFFLADGPKMLHTVLRLWPLDDRYKDQLVVQFGTVSRGVVLATVLSAVAQGLLAGAGFYLTGLQPLFLLIVLTMLLSMVPFIGAVSVWIPACLWLYFHDHHTTAAIGLAIYGAVIVSTVDNIIKPAILHGRSNLHPLLALLSVLGGVKALGPIGIFVGPMIVAFLQTLLEMLYTELQEMRRGPQNAAPPAGSETTVETTA